jgi:hypothetical protein
MKVSLENGRWSSLKLIRSRIARAGRADLVPLLPRGLQ